MDMLVDEVQWPPWLNNVVKLTQAGLEPATTCSAQILKKNSSQFDLKV